MTKKGLLLLFFTAGMILAVIFGVYFYQANRPHSAAEVTALLQDFLGKINRGDLNGARKLMTPETASLLRDPGTELGKVIYRNLALTAVDNVTQSDENIISADVILSVPDTLTITAKAGLMFAEQVTESGPADDPDAAMAAIYEDLLSRENLPVTETFCIVRMTDTGGKLLIMGDRALQQALEGNMEQFPGVK